MRASAHARGYDHRWQKARLTFLARFPLCSMCQKLGRTVAATVVDHIVPHRGDQALFWNTTNWQPLCAPCHDRHKKLIEIGKGEAGCDTSGQPLDPNHHWNR